MLFALLFFFMTPVVLSNNKLNARNDRTVVKDIHEKCWRQCNKRVNWKYYFTNRIYCVKKVNFLLNLYDSLEFYGCFSYLVQVLFSQGNVSQNVFIGCQLQ